MLAGYTSSGGLGGVLLILNARPSLLKRVSAKAHHHTPKMILRAKLSAHLNLVKVYLI